VQVEKFLSAHEALAAAIGEDAVRAAWSADELEIAEEFLATDARSAPNAHVRAAERREPGSSSCCVTGAASRSPTASG
jgi:hypothetical protein